MAASISIPSADLPVIDERTGELRIEWLAAFTRMVNAANAIPSHGGKRQIAIPNPSLFPIANGTTMNVEWHSVFQRMLDAANAIDSFETLIKGVTLIPGATMWGYAPLPIYTKIYVDTEAIHLGGNQTVYEVGFADVWNTWNITDFIESKQKNKVFGIPSKTKYYWDFEDFAYQDATYAFPNAITENQMARINSDVATDWKQALDNLGTQAPNCGAVSLFVGWFGNDLRADTCTIRPKGVFPLDAAYNGPYTAGCETIVDIVSDDSSGYAAYGGTPDDNSIIAAIQDLHDRGYDVIFTPFLLMDVPVTNTLTDPYTGASSQPAYPWRGRITCNPAPGQVGSPDKTAAAASQIATFVGTAVPGDFAIVAGKVVYSGPAEFTYRRFILHCAWLCAAAGGVEGFMIGSEMRGLTSVRDSTSTYPFVDALIALAADVKSILSAADITYAADWAEFFGHQPADGSGDVFFNLDPLWSDSNIAAVAIDNYWPLSDWRDGTDHLDYANYSSCENIDYLQSNIEGGEGYVWYYASMADRNAQIRTPITDSYLKPWVFRYKDIRGWWSNEHYNRPGGVEDVIPTGWIPEGKPFWFSELGCPAIDKGSNQPNVFVDPKSSESAAPYYSSGERNDAQQRAHLNAMLKWYDPNDDAFAETRNPQSSVYSGRMVNINRIMLYTWDARPYPAFPAYNYIWGDYAAWTQGHWLTGRLTS